MDKSMGSPPLMKTHKLLFVSQICLRVFAIAVALAAAWLTLTNKETVVVYGIVADARYSYSPAFKFFAIENLVAFGFSVLSLFLIFILGKKAVDPSYCFFLFIHDLMITLLLMAGCAAATAIGHVGKHGNDHAGWMPICDNFANFCNRATTAALLSYLGFASYLILTIISANLSRHIQV